MYVYKIVQWLTQVEMFISGVLPTMSIYHLPQGQYGYHVLVINISQDVISFANLLPKFRGISRGVSLVSIN